MKNVLSNLTPLVAKTLALTGFMTSIAFVANSAQAATLTVNGTDYSVSFVTGTFDSYQSQIQATPWWGNGQLASDLSHAAYLFDGSPSIVRGPLFAFDVKSSALPFQSVSAYQYNEFGANPYASNASRTYAVQSVPAAVPEPLTILGAITAAGFGVAFKRKKNSTKEE
jgi:hypothetical protein